MNHFELFKLKCCNGLSNQQLYKIILRHSETNKKKYTAIEYARMAELNKTRFAFIESYQSLNLKQVNHQFKQHQMLTIFDKQYPDWLKEIPNPPVVLFYKGNIKYLSTNLLAVVGARNATINGQKAAQKLISPLKNVTIVSGLAKGIDTKAHKIAIKSKLATIAVIGSGLGVCYPLENKALQQYIGSHHLLLSEYLNDTPPLRHHFPERNRIIAGLSRGVVVIEAKLRSGSLITCDCAMNFGREVFAVPGDILNGSSSGCHRLIQQGAKCVEKTTDILEEFYDF